MERDDVMKRLGVIGGLGPIATAYFLELLAKMTDAKEDQQHLEMVILESPSIPDRTSYILDHSKENPVSKLIEQAQKLDAEQVDYISIPCITAHYFYGQIQAQAKTPIIHIIQESVSYLKEYNIVKVGLMATDGTIRSRIFQDALENAGIEVVVPEEKKQTYVMDLIYNDVKANRRVELDKFYSAAASLKGEGAEVIILGCTELSLIKRDYTIGPGFIDAMEVLAMKSIQYCQKPLKKEYEDLISK